MVSINLLRIRTICLLRVNCYTDVLMLKGMRKIYGIIPPNVIASDRRERGDPDRWNLFISFLVLQGLNSGSPEFFFWIATSPSALRNDDLCKGFSSRAERRKIAIWSDWWIFLWSNRFGQLFCFYWEPLYSIPVVVWREKTRSFLKIRAIAMANENRIWSNLKRFAVLLWP